MRGLIVGCGSIGSRHLKNLVHLGVKNLALVEPDLQRRKAFCENEKIMGFDELEKGLEWGPDFVVIATPSHLHVEQALQAAQSNCHLFIEKPLAHEYNGLKQLSEEIEKRKLISIVGCNMRFHPGPDYVKKLIDQEALGKIYFARIHTGSYLPEWRPWQDYRKSYSAHSSMGGGCLLDCIHEIDLARWYIGAVEKVICVSGHLSSLEMDVEDIAALILRHLGGTISEIHLDYVQRTYERGCQIVGENGTIFWNENDRKVRFFNALRKKWTIFTISSRWGSNQMYIDELQHFLTCLHSGKETANPVKDAIDVMQIVFAAKRSEKSSCIEHAYVIG